MSLSNFDRETVIRFDDTNEPAVVYTNNIALKNRLSKLSLEHGDKCHVVEEDGFGGINYLIPKQWLRVSPPRRMSEAQKEKLLLMGSFTRFK